MPIAGDRFSFSRDGLAHAPEAAGVYALYASGEVIYYGVARGGLAGIRARLGDHLAGREGPATQWANEYRCEAAADPIARQNELLDEYLAAHGRLPRCNG
jgi:hypothetical protein